MTRAMRGLQVSAVAAIMAASGGVEARDLSDQLQGIFGPNGLLLQVANPNHSAHFSSASLATLGLLTEEFAPNAADFPAISTVPGFTYHFNSDIQAFERSSNSLGSIYVERPQTLGRGKFDFSLSYLYVDYAGLDGTDLDKLTFRLTHNDCCAPLNNFGVPAFENATIDTSFQKFDLQSHVISLSGTYGITDNWDFNVLLPIITTSMDLTVAARINDVPFAGISTGVHNFPLNPLCSSPTNCKQQTFSASDEQAGVGDLQLRTKYHFVGAGGFNLASGLNLRIPTGNEENFQGVGDTVLTPYVALAQEFGPFDVHGSFGFDVYTGTLERSRARYAVGTAYQPMDKLAFTVDMVGSSNLTTQTISASVPQFVAGATTPSSFTTVSQDVRTDIVDLAIGMKVNPYRSLVAFVNVFVPLNDDGLRAEVVPSGGIQMSF